MTDEEKRLEQQRRQEMIELKKIRQGLEKNTFHKDPHDVLTPPQTFWQNFVYFIKSAKYVLIGIAVLAVVVAVSFRFIVGEPYDMQVTVASVYPINLQPKKFADAFENFATDEDGSQWKVNVKMITFLNQNDPDDRMDYAQEDWASHVELRAVFESNESILFMLDNNTYNYLYANLAGNGEDLFVSYDELGGDQLFIEGTCFEELSGISGMEDLCIVMRRFDEEKLKADEKLNKQYEMAKKVFENMMAEMLETGVSR